MEQANQRPAGAQHAQREVSALKHRGQLGLLIAAQIGSQQRLAFWKGYISAARDLTNGVGKAAATKDEALSGYEAPGDYKAAWAALPDGAERLTMAEVVQILAANGIEPTPHPVANGDIDAVEDLEDSVVSAVDLNDEHPIAGIDCDDGSDHERTPYVIQVTGRQGSGKSTVAALLARAFLRTPGVRCASVDSEAMQLRFDGRAVEAILMHPGHSLLILEYGEPGAVDRSLRGLVVTVEGGAA